MSTNSNSQIAVSEKLGYGFGSAAINAYWQLFATFLTFFYTDVFGLGAAAVGTMFLVTRIFDAVNDPALGAIADRTTTRWGKFRPYILFGALPFALLGFLTFMTPDLSPTAKLVYAYITYICVGIAYTVVNIPFTSLIGVSSENSIQRTGISGYQFVGAFAGVLLVQMLTLDMVEWLGGDENPQLGWTLTIGIYSIFALCALWYAFAVTRERVEEETTKHSNLLREAKILVTSRPWLILAVVSLALVFYASIRGAATLYYLKYFVEREDLTKWYLAIATVACIIGTPLMKPLSSVFGKRNLFAGMMVLGSITAAAHYWIGPEDIILLFVLNFLVGLFSGPIFALIYAMFADIADHIEHEHHARLTGLVFSAGSFAFKFGWTLAGYVAGITLAAFGYEANVEQTAESIRGILLLMSFIPAAAAAFAAFGLIFYPLTEQVMNRIEKELHQRKAEKQETA